MADNQRRYPRHEISIKVSVTLTDAESRILRTRDLSEGGMFLLVDTPEDYPMGEIVHVHYLDPLHDDADTWQDALVVRHAPGGIGVSYIVMDEF
jgi:c-di-GMP-binding flagellar brake protein YcgR